MIAAEEVIPPDGSMLEETGAVGDGWVWEWGAADGERREPLTSTMARWAWGTSFLDLNNDGWPDIIAANGNITGEDPGDL